MIIETEKCKEDFNYFCSEYVKIIHPIKGEVPFVLFPYQERLFDAIQKDKHVICKTFRQGGFTQFMCVHALWKCLFFPNQTNLIVSKSDRESVVIGKNIKYILEKLSNCLNKPTLDYSNMHTFGFSNGSRLDTVGQNYIGIRRPFSNIYIDQMAYFHDASEFWTKIFPTTVTPDSRVLICSIPVDNSYFQEIYESVNQFRIFECNLMEHPDYGNIEWMKNMTELLGYKRFLREVLCIDVSL